MGRREAPSTTHATPPFDPFVVCGRRAHDGSSRTGWAPSHTPPHPPLSTPPFPTQPPKPRCQSTARFGRGWHGGARAAACVCGGRRGGWGRSVFRAYALSSRQGRSTERNHGRRVGAWWAFAWIEAPTRPHAPSPPASIRAAAAPRFVGGGRGLWDGGCVSMCPLDVLPSCVLLCPVGRRSHPVPPAKPAGRST